MAELDSTAQQLIAAANQHAYSKQTDEIRVRSALQRRLAEDRGRRLGWQIPRRLWLAVGVTAINAWKDVGSSVSRIITPAFLHSFVPGPPMLTTFAIISPSPDNCL